MESMPVASWIVISFDAEITWKTSWIFFLCTGNKIQAPAIVTYLQACLWGSCWALSQLSPQQLRGSGHRHMLEKPGGECQTLIIRRHGKNWKERKKKKERERKRGLGVLRSVLLAMVPLKEREMDFLDSSSAGVGSRGAELTCGAAGDGTWRTTKEFRT